MAVYFILFISVFVLTSCITNEEKSNPSDNNFSESTDTPLNTTNDSISSIHTESSQVDLSSEIKVSSTIEISSELIELTQIPIGISTHLISQEIDGIMVERSYKIRTSPQITSQDKLPLVFFFHGAGGSSNVFINNQAYVSLIDSNQFIGIYPNGYSNNGSKGGYWNLGSEPTTADDVEFVHMIINDLKKYHSIDMEKLFATGMSNGAGMVNLLGKESEYFTAIAPTFSQQVLSTSEIQLKRPLSVYQINGVDDRMIPIEGGQVGVGNFLSASESAKNWASQLNCDSSPSSSTHKWGTRNSSHQIYEQCDEDHRVISIEVENTAHGWGDQEVENDAATAIWTFFQGK